MAVTMCRPVASAGRLLMFSICLDAATIVLVAAAVWLVSPSHQWLPVGGAVVGSVVIIVWWRGVWGGSVGHVLLRLRSVDVYTGLPSLRLFAPRVMVVRGEPSDPFSMCPNPVHFQTATVTRQASQPPLLLKLVADDGTCHLIELAAVVGRAPNVEVAPRYSAVAVPDLTRTISRSHFAVEVRQEGVVVTDLESANGTWIEGKDVMLTPGVPELVEWGAVLLVGDRRVWLQPIVSGVAGVGTQ